VLIKRGHPELKISHWYFDQCLYPIKTLSSVKKHLEQVFFYIIFFTYIHLMRCLLSMVNLNVIAVTTLTDVQFTLLLAKNI